MLLACCDMLHLWRYVFTFALAMRSVTHRHRGNNTSWFLRQPEPTRRCDSYAYAFHSSHACSQMHTQHDQQHACFGPFERITVAACIHQHLLDKYVRPASGPTALGRCSPGLQYIKVRLITALRNSRAVSGSLLQLLPRVYQASSAEPAATD